MEKEQALVDKVASLFKELNLPELIDKIGAPPEMNWAIALTIGIQMAVSRPEWAAWFAQQVRASEITDRPFSVVKEGDEEIFDAIMERAPAPWMQGRGG